MGRNRLNIYLKYYNLKIKIYKKIKWPMAQDLKTKCRFSLSARRTGKFVTNVASALLMAPRKNPFGWDDTIIPTVPRCSEITPIILLTSLTSILCKKPKFDKN